MSTNSLRDQFRKPLAPVEPVETNEPLAETDDDPLPDETEYRAYARGIQGRRGEIGLTLFFASGTIEVLYYNYIMRVISYSPEEINIMCTDGVYTLIGRNLRELVYLFRENKLRYVRAYPPDFPPLPANNPEPFIEEIVLETTDDYWERYLQRRAARGN